MPLSPARLGFPREDPSIFSLCQCCGGVSYLIKMVLKLLFLFLLKPRNAFSAAVKRISDFKVLLGASFLKITLFRCNHRFQTPMGKRIPHEIPKAQGYCDLQLSRSQSKRLAPKKKLGSIGGDKEFHTCCAIGQSLST